MILNTEVEKLDYDTIEQIISDFYDLGYPDHSSFPTEFSEETSGNFHLTGTKAYGEFHIRIIKNNTGKYFLSVSVNGKIKKVK